MVQLHLLLFRVYRELTYNLYLLHNFNKLTLDYFTIICSGHVTFSLITNNLNNSKF